VDVPGQDTGAHSPKSVVERAAQASPACRSTHRKLPAMPKWPKVAAEFSGLVQWGDLWPRISAPVPQPLSVWYPNPGRKPPSPGKAREDSELIRAAGNTSGCSSSCANRAKSVIVHSPPFDGGPTSCVRYMPRGSSTRIRISSLKDFPDR
jgi:hypothetical protein